MVGDKGGLAGTRCAGDQRQEGHGFYELPVAPERDFVTLVGGEMGKNACRTHPETITHQSDF